MMSQDLGDKHILHDWPDLNKCLYTQSGVGIEGKFTAHPLNYPVFRFDSPIFIHWTTAFKRLNAAAPNAPQIL